MKTIKKQSRWLSFKLWLISKQKDHCNCTRWCGTKFIYANTTVFIDMHDITVDEPTIIECDECNTKMLLSKYGVAKL